MSTRHSYKKDATSKSTSKSKSDKTSLAPVRTVVPHSKSKSKSKATSASKSSAQPHKRKRETEYDDDEQMTHNKPHNNEDDADDIQLDAESDDEAVPMADVHADGDADALPDESESESEAEAEVEASSSVPTTKITSTKPISTKIDPFQLILTLCDAIKNPTPIVLTPLQQLHHIASHPPQHLTLQPNLAKQLLDTWTRQVHEKPHDTVAILLQDAASSLPIDVPFLVTSLTRRLSGLIHSRLHAAPSSSSFSSKSNNTSFHDLYTSFITDAFASEWEQLRGEEMDARRVDVLADGIRQGANAFTDLERQLLITGFRQQQPARKKRERGATNYNTSAPTTTTKPAATSSTNTTTQHSDAMTGEDLIESGDGDAEMTVKHEKKNKNKDGKSKGKNKDKQATLTETEPEPDAETSQQADTNTTKASKSKKTKKHKQ